MSHPAIEPVIGTIAVAGDWHGDKRWMSKFVRWAASKGVACIVHVGDIGFFQMRDLTFLEDELARLDIVLLWAEGNHENHELIATLPLDDGGLHFITEHIRHVPRGVVVPINQQRWMFFGGASSIDKELRTEGVNWWRGELITPGDVMRLADDKVDVLITHEVALGAPTIDNRYKGESWWPASRVRESNEQRALLAEVVERVRPDFLFHGHHHLAYVDRLDNTLVVGLDKEETPWDHNAALVHLWGEMEFMGRTYDFPPVGEPGTGA